MRSMDFGGGSSIVGFLAATVVFAVSFATVIQFSVNDEPTAAAAHEATYHAMASSLADVLLASPGKGWYLNGLPCLGSVINVSAFQPDRVQRLGLGEEPCAQAGDPHRGVNNLSFSKIENLYQAAFEAKAANGYVDYLEARDGLALDDMGFEFHVRSWPVLPSVQQALEQGYKDPNMRVLYIGDYSKSAGGAAPPPYITGLIDQSERVIVFANVTNDAASSTIFDALFELELKTGKVSFTLHTKVLGPGESGNMSFTLLKTADWEWKSSTAKNVEVEIHDKDTKLADATISLSSVTMTNSSTRVNVFAEAEKLSTILSGPGVDAKYYYSAFDGKGKPAQFGDWTYTLYDPAGNLVRTDVLPTEKEGNVAHTFTAAGSYVARLWNDALATEWNEDVVNVVSSEPGPYGGAPPSFTPGPAVRPEIRFIDSMIELFDANAFSSRYNHSDVPYVAGGDVYPDIRDAMDDDLPAALTDDLGAVTLADYTTLIVGSNVDHNSMTKMISKETIKDWVIAGGTLIVFGSDDQSVSWLQPLFHASLDTASGGVSTPDENHPVLKVPNDLDYESFKYGTEWSYNAGADTRFTHVVTAGAEGDLLGVGDAGAFGAGRVILSGWRPYDLTVDQSTSCPDPLTPDSRCQAVFLIHNFVTMTYRALYLDYGPPIPTGALQGVQSRIGLVCHPELDQCVDVFFIVYVFD